MVQEMAGKSLDGVYELCRYCGELCLATETTIVSLKGTSEDKNTVQDDRVKVHTDFFTHLTKDRVLYHDVSDCLCETWMGRCSHHAL